MRVLVCGDREWTDRTTITEHLLSLPRDATIIHGACRGADTLAGQAASFIGMKVEPYPADWARYGRGAGPKRNQQMLNSGIDLVLAFHTDIVMSKGTRDMVRRAHKAGITVEVIDVHIETGRDT